MYNKLGYGWGNSLMGFIALPLGLLFPLLIFRYGEGWRIAAEKRIERVEASQRASAAASAARHTARESEKSARH